MITYPKITLYQNCKIMPWANFYVDDIGTYLASLTTHLDLNEKRTQFLRHGLEISIKVQLSESELELANLNEIMRNNNYNYLRVLTSTDVTPQVTNQISTYYYFVLDKKFISENCVELKLKMDVINTLRLNLYTLSPRTTIIREHKNRWAIGSEPFRYKPLIDFYSEGLNAPLYKTKEATLFKELRDSSFDYNNYYLVYRADQADTNSAIKVHLFSDHSFTISGGTAGYTGTKNVRAELGVGIAWVIYRDDAGTGSTDNRNATITFEGKTAGGDRATIQLLLGEANACVVIRRDSIGFGTLDATGVHLTNFFYPASSSNFGDVSFDRIYAVREMGHLEINSLTSSNISSKTLSTAFPTTLVINTTGSISDINRTDPRLVKIIKLPYCPISLNINSVGEVSSLPAGWYVQSADGEFPVALTYSYRNLTECFKTSFFVYDEEYEYNTPFTANFAETSFEPAKAQSRSSDYETKLFHSDYYLQKFVYDSFAYTFKGELFPELDGEQDLSLEMYTTSTMNSKFMFRFTGWQPTKDTQDYSNLVYVARNNELPLYNSDYLNYIRSGYNYDIKTKNRNLASSIVMGGIGIVGGIAGFALGGAGAVAGVALATSAVSKIAQTAFSTAQAEQTIEQKLKQAELAGTSVIGGDDVDLLDVYTNGNKAKLVKYEVSEKMKRVLSDLFHYAGYVANYQGVPDVSTRTYFNFVMADVFFANYPRVSEEIINELAQKYKAGITFLHKVVTPNENGVNVNVWDFEQQFENWENGLIPTPTLVSSPAPAIIEISKEYVIGNDVSALTSHGRLVTASNGIIWRKRRKSDLAILDERKGLFRIGWNSPLLPNRMAVYVEELVPVRSVNLSDYTNADYYWTIEFIKPVSSTLQPAQMQNSIIGYIRYTYE